MHKHNFQQGEWSKRTGKPPTVLVSKFRAIPHGDEVLGPRDYANRLLDFMYHYADDRRIWIEV